VFSDRAFVRLVTDSQSKVAAQVQGTQVEGIVRGSPGRGLTFDLAQADIKVGDTVVTSGLGGNYPPGIPIAKVSSVSGTAQDLFRKVKVDPLVRLSTARTVLVLTSFVPQRIDVTSP
jgi:rod shape-determining protein MreC